MQWEARKKVIEMGDTVQSPTGLTGVIVYQGFLRLGRTDVATVRVRDAHGVEYSTTTQSLTLLAKSDAFWDECGNDG